MLIKGSDLSPRQRQLVLAAYVHRWTFENSKQTYGGKCPACEQSGGDYEVVIPAGQQAAEEIRKRWHDHHVKLVTDDEWLAVHAFHFVANGSRLQRRKRFAEPAWMVA